MDDPSDGVSNVSNMTTAPAQPMSLPESLAAPDEFSWDCHRIILRDVPWDDYVRLRDSDSNRHVRMAYYRGTLELTSPGYRHEKYSRRLDRLVWELVVALEVPCACAGSTTFRKDGAEAGKEPDSCFYFANEPLIRDKEEIDLGIDPPPDLAIDVDDSRNSEGKLPIYAALRIPEVWRYDAKAGALWFGRLQADGTYARLTQSECLPLLTPELVLEALNLCRGVPDLRWWQLLREWIKGLSP
jgi:Uma2 family endonuclease